MEDISKLKNMVGKCEYCGNEFSVLASSQAEANKMAAEQCSCPGQRIAEKKTMLKEKLKELTGPGCEELNFRPVENSVMDLIEGLGCLAIEGKVQSISVKVDGTTISIKAGEKTKVSRKYLYEQGEDIE